MDLMEYLESRSGRPKQMRSDSHVALIGEVLDGLSSIGCRTDVGIFCNVSLADPEFEIRDIKSREYSVSELVLYDGEDLALVEARSIEGGNKGVARKIKNSINQKLRKGYEFFNYYFEVEPRCFKAVKIGEGDLNLHPYIVPGREGLLGLGKEKN